MIYYIRDENGELIGLRYNNNTYFYKKNYQGDIIGIYDSNYDIIVNYSYDSWGNILSITDNNNNEITDPTNIGIINPYRYRSYYYDTETKLYYLNSRYYNPKWGRFINADGIIGTSNNTIYNLYLYCENNPVNMCDETGDFAGTAVAIGIGITVVGLLLYGTAKYGSTIGQGLADICHNIWVALETTVDSFKDTKEDKSKEKDKDKQKETIIYRYGKSNPGNLTPRQSDVESSSGLSFSTLPNLFGPSVQTTIEEINSTGVLVAIKNGKHHVSVYPVGASLQDWYDAGNDSIWTQTLKSIVIKWDGDFK